MRPLIALSHSPQAHNDHIILETDNLLVKVNTSGCPRLEWFAKDSDGRPAPTSFLADSPSRAYSFDAASGGVIHMVERENHLPVSEDEFTTVGPQPFLHDERNEFVYGLGESRGTMEKSGKKFTMEGRDALSYDWENGSHLFLLDVALLLNLLARRGSALQGQPVRARLQQGDETLVRNILQQPR